MRRIDTFPARVGWQDANRRLGLVYDGDNDSYWREGAAYAFTMDEIGELHTAAERIQQALMEVGDRIAVSCPRHRREVRASAVLSRVCPGSGCLLDRIGVPEYAHEQIIRTWFDGDVDTWTHWDKDIDASAASTPQTGDFSPWIYGRFDFQYAGAGSHPKLLEYNAQTPTVLLEASVIQWEWQWQVGATDHPERQWNNIHDALIAAWRRNMGKLVEARPWLDGKIKIYFAYERTEVSGEDLFNVAYLEETARAAGFDTQLICMDEIGHNIVTDRIEHSGTPIDVIFALYPWEWIWHEEGGKPIFRDMADVHKRGTVWINPPYSAAMLGNKAILPLLWQLFGDDPRYADYLLPAYFGDEHSMRDYAIKPIWGREGSSTVLVRDGRQIEVNYGNYGREGFIAQQLCPLPAFEGIAGVMHPVLGIWMVDGEPVGMGIRESAELITSNGSSFVPHIIEHPRS